jgi:hypothetical protein
VTNNDDDNESSSSSSSRINTTTVIATVAADTKLCVKKIQYVPSTQHHIFIAKPVFIYQFT